MQRRACKHYCTFESHTLEDCSINAVLSFLPGKADTAEANESVSFGSQNKAQLWQIWLWKNIMSITTVDHWLMNTCLLIASLEVHDIEHCIIYSSFATQVSNEDTNLHVYEATISMKRKHHTTAEATISWGLQIGLPCALHCIQCFWYIGNTGKKKENNTTNHFQTITLSVKSH